MIRTLAIAVTLLLSGGAHAADKKTQVLIMEPGSTLITDLHKRQSVLTGSQKGGSLIITDPRTMKTIAVIPKEKK